jgi:phage repressor protein C with HTH and peptisase S24 domain
MIKCVSMKFSEWLSDKLTSRHLKPSQLALYSKISGAEISRLCSGKRQPSLKTIKKIAPILHVTEIETLEAANIIPAKKEPTIEIFTHSIPVVSAAGATDDEGRSNFHPYEPPYKVISFKGCKAVVIESNSMAPLAYKGQKIIYNEAESVRDGDLVFVKFKNDAQLFKRYYKNHDDIITFHSINPVESPKPIIKRPKDIEFCYKVVGISF